MRSEPRFRAIDRRIGQLADGQQGSVSRRQLLALGLSADGIVRRIEKGVLRPRHRGVYLLGHRAPARYAAEMCAVLAYAPGAAVSHRSAARMWEVLPYPATGEVWITVTRKGPERRRGVRVHHSTLTKAEVRRLDGVPLTAPARTLVDIAAIVESEQLERAVAQAQVRRWVTESELRRQLERYRGRRGVGRLRALLDRYAEPAYTESEAERVMLRLVRAAGLPEPRTGAWIGPYRVDFLWPDQRVVVEVDGYAFHSHRAAFGKDRARTNDLQLRGYTVLRFTWVQLKRQPALVRERLRAALLGRNRD